MITYASPQMEFSDLFSFFKKSKYDVNNVQKQALFTADGRTALYKALQILSEQGSAKKWLIPAYCCPSVFQVFLDSNIECEFYPLIDNLLPDFNYLYDRIQQNDDVHGIMFIHYFGFLTDWSIIKEVLLQRKIKVIEDCAHCLMDPNFSFENTDCDAQVYSMRKWLPLPHGGCLLLQEKYSKLLSRDCDAELAAFSRLKLLLRIFCNTVDQCTALNFRGLLLSVPHLDKYLDEHDSRNNKYDLLMNPRVYSFFQKCLKMLSLIKEIQRENYLFLQSTFCNDERFFFHQSFTDVDCPFVFPIYVQAEKRDDLHRKCLRNGVIARIYWRFLPKQILDKSNLFKFSLQASSKILCLPIHYKLSTEHLDHISKTLQV